MYIESIKIGSFGKLSAREFELEKGINVIEGRNESGKSTLCEFIRFVFYGLSNKSVSGGLSDRKRYVSWANNGVSGSLVLNDGDNRYRIERSLVGSGESYKEELTVVDLANNSVISGIKVPGEYFFGVPETVFTHTVYIRQSEGAYFNGGDIGQAVQNMFYSADESVNTEKALKKLDDARVLIKHKKNTGRGLLDGLEKERDALIPALEESRKESGELLEAENSLDMTKKSLERNGSDRERLSGGLRKAELEGVLDKFEKRRYYFDMAEQSRKKAAELEESYAYNGFFPDVNYVSETVRVRNEISILQTSGSAFELHEDDDDVQVYSKELAGVVKSLGGLNGIIERVNSDLGKGRTFVILAVVFGIISAALATFPLLFKDFGGKLWFFAGAGIAAVCCVSFIWRAFNSFGKNKKLYSRFEVRDDGELFETVATLETCVQAEKQRNERMAEKLARKEEYDAKVRSVVTEAAEHLAVWGRTPETKSCNDVISCLDGVLNDVKELNAGLEKLDRERDKNEAMAEMLGSQLKGCVLEKIKEEHDSIEYESASPNIEEAKKKLDFIEKANRSLAERVTELERFIAEKKAKTLSPADIESRLAEVRRRIEELNFKHDAYLLAYDSLQKAGSQLRNRLAPGLSEMSGSLMDGLTEGKYKSIGVSDNLEMTYTFEDENGAVNTKTIETVSAGTKDIAYISLRLALASLLGKSEKMLPVVFDEAFSRLDKGRLAKMLEMLNNYADKGAQVLIMSSQSRESAVLSEMDSADGINRIDI